MRNIIFISFLLLLFSCKSGSQKKTSTTAQSEQEPEWFSIELAKTLSDATKEQKPYATFVKDIEYIPLQTSSKSLVGGRRIFKTHVVTKKVIVVDMKIFSRKDGRYIGDLLSRGKAAKEYLHPSFLAADDEREEFYLFEPDKAVMHRVGYDNRYKEKVDWNWNWDLNQYFVLGNGNLLIPREQLLVYSLDDFEIINIDTKEVLSKRLSSALTNLENLEDCKHIVFPPDYVGYVSMGSNVFWKYKDNIRYYDYLTDSLYTIDKNMKVKPIGTLDFEKLKQTRNQALVAYYSRSFLTWRISRIAETSDEILISFYSYMTKPGGGADYLLSYSKANKTAKITTQRDRLPRDMTPPSPYLNDFDNGISFSPRYATQNESAYYEFLTPLQIKEIVSEKGDSAYTTEREKAFKAMADTLKDDDNEVVAILHVDW